MSDILGKLEKAQSEMTEAREKATREIQQALFEAGWKRTTLSFTFPQRPAKDEYELRSVQIAEIPVWRSPKGNYYMDVGDFNEGIEAQKRFDQIQEPTSTLAKIMAEK